jgi:hypothetical protein
MKQVYVVVSAMLLSFCSLFSQAQTVATNTNVVVPPLVSFSGVLTGVNGKPLTGVVGVTFLLYQDQQGGAPLWMETQNVEPDSRGHYTVMLGSTSSSGLPADIFVSGEAHWLGVQAQGQEEQPRVLLVSAPYALKAGDAQTLGGLPASAFALAAPPSGATPASTVASSTSAPVAASVSSDATSDVTTTGGTVNTLPLFSTATNIQNSLLTQTGTTAINVGGKLNLPTTGTATASAGKDSQPQDFVASAFNSGISTAVAQTFQLQAEAAGNDTATTSGTFNLLYGSGTAALAETGFKISSKGLITFATGQTFPGTGKGTVTSVDSGDGLTGGPITGSGTLSIATGGVTNAMLANPSITVTAGTDLTGGGSVALGATTTLNVNTAALNSAYAQLAVANTFAPQQVIKGNGGNAIIGDPGCGSGFSGIGLTSSTLSGCSNYTMLGKSSGDVYLNSTSTGFIHFRNGNSGSNTYDDLATIDNKGNLTAAGTVAGTASSSGAFGVTGVVTATTGTAAGVLGGTSSPLGYGVLGLSQNVGVYGQSTGASKAGAGFSGAGVWGDTSSAEAAGGGVLGTADDNNAAQFFNNSPVFAAVFADNESASSGSLAFQTGGLQGDFCTIDIAANLTCTGKITGMAPSDGGAHQVSLYAMQSPENWFEDFGSGVLTNGAMTVPLDPTFASTVNTAIDYHVFLTPRGECEGLYVSNLTASGFEVRELHHGSSNVAFDYRIVAKRAGYENQRLEDVTGRYQKMLEQEEKRRERMQQLRAARAASALPVPPATKAIGPIAPAGSAAGPIPLHR